MQLLNATAFMGVDMMSVQFYIQIMVVCVLIIVLIKVLYHTVTNYLVKRPRCPNGYNCADCIHSDIHWDGQKFRGFSCGINAR